MPISTEKVDIIVSHRENGVISDSNNDGNGIETLTSDEQWTCGTCTLFNTADSDFCEACGIPRYNDDFYNY